MRKSVGPDLDMLRNTVTKFIVIPAFQGWGFQGRGFDGLKPPQF